ncbi:MAG: hypothetical protein GTN38_01990 [Candidatus Aenigmarchaeota archaeon]|nr:hypothetical protein [Candidatus Aenigmarchaeota archaeon]NIP40326.1 hypothetical protein [Candidatus Aenigmarchaeota archaeon]NIQ17820.1 hypothetical protein [Candidatus Aenigmarchaeota archaeon]NIS73201.1 hypothetical protein [Candidatus Aenigmarchaeota archaeon]
MKKISFMFVTILGLVLLMQTAYAAAPSLNVVLSSQNPYPVEPGGIVTVEIELQNTGYSEATDIVLKIEPEDPFTLVLGETETKTFTKISASDSIKSTYKLHVSESAVSNDYDLHFRYYKGTDPDITVEKSVSVRVQGSPKLILSSINTDPEDVEPGDTVRFEVDIKNVGTGRVHYMEATFNSSSPYIVPVLAGGSYYMGELDPGSSEKALFDISIGNDAEYGTYPATLTLSYRDDTNTLQSTTFSVGVPIKGQPVIEVLSAKIDNSDFKVDIENIGTGNAKALKISLVQGGEVKDSAIANELKPTRHKTLRFKGFSYGEAAINITYLDESNNEFTREIPVSIKQSVYAEDQGQGGGVSPTITAILIVIVVLETFYVWRIRKRKK